MNILIKNLLEEKGIGRLTGAIESGKCPAVLSGASGIQKAYVISALHAKTERPVFVVCSDEAEAERLCGDIEFLTGEPALILGGRDFVFHNAEGVSRQREHNRLSVLRKMAGGFSGVVLASIEGALQRTIPPKKMRSAGMELISGGTYDLDEITKKLVNAGYTRSELVEGAGQFALRGGILDFFSPEYMDPVRCEFFGDELDSMGYFDVKTQRRTKNLEKAEIIPVSETLFELTEGGKEGFLKELSELKSRAARRKNKNEKLISTISADMERVSGGGMLPAADRYMSLIYEKATAMDYLSADSLLIMCEPKSLKERAEGFKWQLNEDVVSCAESGNLDSLNADFVLDYYGFLTAAEEYPVVMLDSFLSGNYPMTVKTLENITSKQLPSYGGSLETAASDILHYIETGYKTLVLCRDKNRAELMKDYLDGKNIRSAFDFELTKMPERGECVIGIGSLSAGTEYPDLRTVIMTEGQIIGKRSSERSTKPKRQRTNRERVESYSDLTPGDLVVHEHYGIGRFAGIFKMTVDKAEKDYIKIAFAGTDSLYIPVTQLDMVSKYIGTGGEDKQIKLSKMGGTDWKRTKSRARAAVKELAKGLVELQFKRMKAKGFAFSPDSVWQTEFEDSFGYEETDDQLRCIREIKADMEKAVPMDRLLCGDVGYGKTEVALRAVMKCILDGKQAAILVPTTVLAQQHFVTASGRFADFPVTIELLSRFRSSQQIKQSIKNIETGTADLVIGTHRLLQKDVVFKDLGLLIVDEEQRFGVAHKEKLKELAVNVDVLTLSATPIPRTLNMALSGLRDMSSIEEPPRDRQPVQTYVIEHDWGMICDAIRREVSRGGQVYYLHNRVDNIERTAAKIREMLGDVSVGIAHGKMDETGLSRIMNRMAEGDIQVLVCTTIIETGIDIPNVNTLIIEDADKMGLSQLHQLRGRVGRSSRRAFSYLTFRKGKVLSEIAEKRLSAIREFAEFNSGFKIAMRDLEIRGAGNVLGAEQSGHITDVGYDMYLKMLEDAVREEKGEKPEIRTECSADMSVSANIPESYVPSSEQRMDLYRRMAAIRTEEDADDIYDELLDRYGDIPRSVNALIRIALMRAEAANAGITEIVQKNGSLMFTLAEFDMERISELYGRTGYKGALKIQAGEVPVIALRIKSGADVIDTAVKLIRDYTGTAA